MDLYVARIGEVSTLAIALNGSCTVAAHRVGREEVSVTITTGSDDHGIGREALQLAAHQVLGDDTTCVAIDNHHILHLITGVEFHLTLMHLTAQRRVGTQEELLSGLSLGVEGT